VREVPPYKSGNVVVAAAVSIALLFIAGAYRFGAIDTSAPPINPILSNTKALDIVSAEPADSDADGYPDWQEILTGSDPNNPESQPPEVALRLPQEGGGGAMEEGAVTVTDQVAQRLITEYFSLNRTGDEASVDPKQIGNKLAQGVQMSVAFEPYVRSDAVTSISANTDKTTYRNAMKVAVEPLLGISSPEFELYGLAVETGDAKYLVELLGAANVYRETATRIMEVPPPEDALSIHVETANSLAYFAAVLENLVHYINDPIASLALLRSYNEAEEYMRSIFTLLGTYYATE